MAFISQIIQQHPDAGYWHQQYPWFSIGQLVNAANNKETPGFTESARRTAVFFNDIPRLHWLLYQQEADLAALRSLVNPETETTTQNGLASIGTTSVETKHTEENSVANEALLIQENVMPAETVAAPVTETLTAIETFNEIKTEPAKLTPFVTAGETLPESEIEPSVEDGRFDPAVTNSHTTHQPSDNSWNADTFANESDIEEPESNEGEEPELIPLPTDMLSESLAQAADSYKNSVSNDDTMVFKTAYQHTIDYFASQGIKLEGEPAMDDRFGRQVKTFTSWLRQMKRLPDAPVQEADPLVESHAAHSLQKGEVVTEPMADVLLKQGKTGQAIAVLEKLRLLHPQKSHYFAARINQIKHT